MRTKKLLFIAATAFTVPANAQNWVEDSVIMTPGYASDGFYSLKNGVEKMENNQNWHLAFQMTPPGPYGNVSILANHVQGGVNVFSLHMSASTYFTSLVDADTVGKTASTQILLNSDTSWNFGAFNQMSSTDPLDYSWGFYDMTSHNVVGDSLYLVKTAAATYKVWVQEFVSNPVDSIHWTFRIASYDGTEDTTIKIYRTSGYTNRLFAYYNAATQTIVDREPNRPDWDILFTRYREYLVGAPAPPYYPVMGILSNFDVTVAEKNVVGPDDTVAYPTYNYHTAMNEIGSTWKVFDMAPIPPVWVIDDSTYFFIKTENTNEYYQLAFTDFGGSSTGKVVFKKRFLGAIPSGVKNIASPVTAFFLSPNPAQNELNIVLDTKEKLGNAQLMVTDISGKLLRNIALNNVNGFTSFQLNTSEFVNGTYIITITNGNWKLAEKLIIQH